VISLPARRLHDGRPTPAGPTTRTARPIRGRADPAAAGGSRCTPSSRARPSGRAHRCAPALAALLGLGLLLPACGAARSAARPTEQPPSGPPRAPSTSAPLGGDAASAGTSAAVEAAYRRFWAVADDVDSRPPDQWRSVLATVTADPLLSRIVDGLLAQRAAGHRQYGQVVPHPTVVGLSIGTASVLDCQDASRAGEADADSGLPATAGNPRTPVAATLVRSTDGRWRVDQARYLPGAC
jgi:hypothetical protein